MRKSFFYSFVVIWRVLNVKQRINYILSFFLCSLRSLYLLSLPQVIACLTAKVVGEKTTFYGIPLPQSLSFTAVLAINFGILVVLGAFATWTRARLSRFIATAKGRYREVALKHLLTPRKNMDLKKTNGEIIYIVESSASAVETLINTFFISVFPYMVSALIAVIYLFTINVYLALGALAVAVIVLIMGIVRAKLDKRCFIRMDKVTSKVNNNIRDCISNLPFISFINTAYHEIGLLKEEHKKYQKQVDKRAVIWTSYWSLLYFIEYAYMFLGIFLLVNSYGLAAIGINTIILMISYMDKFFSPLNDLGHNINILVSNGYRINRIEEFVPTEDEKFDPGEDRFENKILRKEKITKIDMNHIEVKIGNLHKKDVNMGFEVGKLSCIVGTSGSGKTTLMGCLLGLKEYQHGDIIINNKYKVRSLFYNSAKVCLTLQNGCIFDRSVMDNICYPNHEPNASAKRNIERFNLENLILRTQDIDNINLEAVISGGERRRIAIARTASRLGDVYIFDEPTNDLDNENVQIVLSILNRLKKKHIVIVISHDRRVTDISDYIYHI